MTTVVFLLMAFIKESSFISRKRLNVHRECMLFFELYMYCNIDKYTPNIPNEAYGYEVTFNEIFEKSG